MPKNLLHPASSIRLDKLGPLLLSCPSSCYSKIMESAHSLLPSPAPCCLPAAWIFVWDWGRAAFGKARGGPGKKGGKRPRCWLLGGCSGSDRPPHYTPAVAAAPAASSWGSPFAPFTKHTRGRAPAGGGAPQRAAGWCRCTASPRPATEGHPLTAHHTAPSGEPVPEELHRHLQAQQTVEGLDALLLPPPGSPEAGCQHLALRPHHLQVASDREQPCKTPLRLSPAADAGGPVRLLLRSQSSWLLEDGFPWGGRKFPTAAPSLDNGWDQAGLLLGLLLFLAGTCDYQGHLIDLYTSPSCRCLLQGSSSSDQAARPTGRSWLLPPGSAHSSHGRPFLLPAHAVTHLARTKTKGYSHVGCSASVFNALLGWNSPSAALLRPSRPCIPPVLCLASGCWPSQPCLDPKMWRRKPPSRLPNSLLGIRLLCVSLILLRTESSLLRPCGKYGAPDGSVRHIKASVPLARLMRAN